MKKPKIIAHRGASFNAPEHTLASVNFAWKQNIHNVEVDIKLSQDNVIVVFHDDTTIRYNQIDKLVNKYNLEELLKIDVGSFKGEQWTNEFIPTLDQVLKTIPVNGTLIVELKDGPEMESALISLEKKNTNIWKQLEFISFNYASICMVKTIFPNNKCLWLLDLDYNEETAKNTPSNKEIIDKVKKHNLDGINVFAGEFANESFFKTMQQENFEVYLWTINKVEHAKQYLPFLPDGLTTDRPKWMSEQLNITNDK